MHHCQNGMRSVIYAARRISDWPFLYLLRFWGLYCNPGIREGDATSQNVMCWRGCAHYTLWRTERCASRSSPRSRINHMADARCMRQFWHIWQSTHAFLTFWFLWWFLAACRIGKGYVVYLGVIYSCQRLVRINLASIWTRASHHLQWRSAFSSFQYTWLSSSRQCHLVAFQGLCRWEAQRVLLGSFRCSTVSVCHKDRCTLRNKAAPGVGSLQNVHACTQRIHIGAIKDHISTKM